MSKKTFWRPTNYSLMPFGVMALLFFGNPNIEHIHILIKKVDTYQQKENCNLTRLRCTNLHNIWYHNINTRSRISFGPAEMWFSALHYLSALFGFYTCHSHLLHQNVCAHKSLPVSLPWAGSVSHSVICRMQHPGMLLTPSSKPEGGTADISAQAYRG